MNAPRHFTPQERSFLDRIAEALTDDRRAALLADVAKALVVEEGDFLSVELEGYERPRYAGHRSLPFEGKLNDVEGGPISILVNIDQNARLLEIEFIWWQSESGTELDWSTLQIVPEP